MSEKMHGYFSAEKFLVFAPVALTSHFFRHSRLGVEKKRSRVY
jgi:hypothetical protein